MTAKAYCSSSFFWLFSSATAEATRVAVDVIQVVAATDYYSVKNEMRQPALRAAA